MLERAVRRFQGAHRGFDFGGGRNQDSDEVERAGANRIDAVENEATGGGVDEVDDVIELAAELVDVFAVEGGDEGLVELGENGVSDLVALMLEGFNNLDLFGYPGVMRQHFEQGLGPVVDVGRLLGKKVEETLFAGQEALQKSRHVVWLPPEESAAEAGRV